MGTFSSALTKPGQLREGFYYQDLYGMHLALSWLEHPVDFLWMRLEADEFGSLDDVVILRSDHILSLNQIKHVTERPERPSLSLDDLLKKKSARARSLFQKWFQSWLSVEADPIYKAIDAIIHTNRPPAEDLAALLVGGTTQKIDPSVFRAQAPTVFAEFVEQAGEDGSRLDDFFSAITFRFNSADIEPAEQVLRDRASRLKSQLRDFLLCWITCGIGPHDAAKMARPSRYPLKRSSGHAAGERSKSSTKHFRLHKITLLWEAASFSKHSGAKSFPTMPGNLFCRMSRERAKA
jgi:hypothetical protein